MNKSKKFLPIILLTILVGCAASSSTKLSDEVETIPDILPLENSPKPIGGLKGIEEKVVYPEIARKAGIQGQVQIRVYVDKEGKPTRCEVLRSLGNNGCDEAAKRAIMETKFIPAMLRDKAIPFHLIIPIDFKLKSGSGSTDYNLNKYEEKIIDFNKRIELDPELDMAYYYRGFAYDKLENYSENQNKSLES
jgi:TonB family protein